MKSWSGKVGVVTGGAGGIGLAIAQGLVRRGVSVVIADIEQTALDAAVMDLTSLGGTVAGHRTDVSDFAAMQGLAAFCAERFGAVHLLFNNAGVSITGPSWQLNPDDWRWVWSVNLGGVVHGIKVFLPAMLEHAEEAYIVNTGSLACFSGHGDHGPYCASKAAVLSLSQTLYSEMRAAMTRVSVSIVCPGLVATRIHESWRNRPGGDEPWSSREREDPQWTAVSGSYQASGTTPDVVADAVFEGMLADRFYIFPNAGSDVFIRASLERAMAAENPRVSTWGLDRRPFPDREWSPWTGSAGG